MKHIELLEQAQRVLYLGQSMAMMALIEEFGTPAKRAEQIIEQAVYLKRLDEEKN